MRQHLQPFSHTENTGRKKKNQTTTYTLKKKSLKFSKICFVKVGSAFQKYELKSFCHVLLLALTRQRALRLLQVEDFMEGSLFGAVRATRLFLSAHPARDSGQAAP